MVDDAGFEAGSEGEPDLDEVSDELPEEVDQAAVDRMRMVATILDDSIRIPGTNFRIGADPIIGLLPGGGDALASAFSLYIVAEAARLGVSLSTIVRMLVNVAIDTVGGTLPLVGDLFDAYWKANRRNVDLALADLGVDVDSVDRGDRMATHTD